MRLVFYFLENNLTIIKKLIIVQKNKTILELLGEAIVAPIPIPKTNKAPISDNNILFVMINCPTFKGLNFIHSRFI